MNRRSSGLRPRCSRALAAIAAILCVCSSSMASGPTDFNGGRAFKDLERLVKFGPRPSGSPALSEARNWMLSSLKGQGVKVQEDSFTASTPAGDIPMTNLIAKFPGARPKVVLIAGHYDTARSGGATFVGANDGGSSAAFLLEMARVLSKRKNDLTYWLVFLDGEEAVQQWSDTDSLYGSRHLVARLSAEGEIGHIQAMILVDMIGDAKLDIYRDYNSTAWLTDRVFSTAHRLGYGSYFLDQQTAIQDDHIPFVNAGVPAVDIIDLDYGPRTAAHPNGSYWHTSKDTIDHCGAQSLTIVGRVVTATLDELEKDPRLK